jgi:hypothetical protein
MDVAHGEMVEQQLDAMIQRRTRKGDLDPDEREELWKASVRAYTARRREEMRAAWTSYHEGQAERHRRTLRELIDYHETQAERLLTKGDTQMTEQMTEQMGATGLSYGSKAAEEMISDRIHQLHHQ